MLTMAANPGFASTNTAVSRARIRPAGAMGPMWVIDEGWLHVNSERRVTRKNIDKPAKYRDPEKAKTRPEDDAIVYLCRGRHRKSIISGKLR